VRREVAQLGIEVRIVDTGLDHPRLEVVDHHRLRHPAKVAERILKRPQKALCFLRERDLGVGLAAATEHDAEEVGLPPLSIRTDDPCPRSVVNLALRPRQCLHAAEGQLRVVAKLPDIALHGLIASFEALLHLKILEDSLGA